MGSYGTGFDFGGTFDDIIRAAKEFGEKMKGMGPDLGTMWAESGCGSWGHHAHDERFYFYPPTNSYTTKDGSLVFEFALAGIDESVVSVTFQGDFLVLSAKAAARDESDDSRFSRRGFRPRDIDRQKYRVPAEDYAQELAKAVFKNGVLTVTVPPKHSEGDGIKIDIVKEGN